MIAVPVVANRQTLGVRYAANRQDTAFGDRVTQAPGADGVAHGRGPVASTILTAVRW